MRRSITSTVTAIVILVLSWAIPYYIEVNSMITSENSYWLLIISIVGTLIMICVLVWGFWPMMRKIRFQKPIKLVNQTSTTTLDAQAANTGYEQRSADWMSANTEYEKRNPRHFIYARPDWFGLYLDSVSGAFILFRFAIRTSTIHTFKFLPEKTSGHIKYMKQDLARIPEVEDQSHSILTRETQTMLAVKQFLEPVTESHIRKLHDNQEVPEVSFEFGELNIYIQATQPDGSIDKELWKLPLPGAWKVRIADEDIRS